MMQMDMQMHMQMDMQPKPKPKPIPITKHKPTTKGVFLAGWSLSAAGIHSGHSEISRPPRSILRLFALPWLRLTNHATAYANAYPNAYAAALIEKYSIAIRNRDKPCH
jgi:hypothetical protein